MREKRFPWLVGLALAALAGCGDDDSNGGDAGVGADTGMEDAGPADNTPPTVVATEPEDGVLNVDPGVTIFADFSESMNRMAGQLGIEPAGLSLNADTNGLWASEDSQVRFDLSAMPLDAGVEYTATLSGFEDVAGNGLAAPFVFSFTVPDVDPPTITECTPEERANEVAVDLAEITCTFNEPMDTMTGEVIFSGGNGAVGEPTWNAEGTVITIPVTSELESAARFAVGFEGFSDLFGNRIDSSVYLIDGFLDFRTGADVIGPRVEDSFPTEAAMNVPLSATQFVLTFDEPMDISSASSVVLLNAEDEEIATLSGVWAPSRRSIRFPLGDVELAFETSYKVRLTMLEEPQVYRDFEGNALNADQPYLIDGVLDFTTAPAEVGPAVILSDPLEGSEIPYDPPAIYVRFNTTMDTMGMATFDLPITGGSSPVTALATWELGDTQLRIDVPFGQLEPAAAIQIDFTGFTDTDGQPLIASDPYLGDGYLDYVTEPPSGDGCRDILTADAAVMDGGRMLWDIRERVYRQDFPGIGLACETDSRVFGEAVVRYVKTTPSLSDDPANGRLLRVGATSLDNDDVNLEVRSGAGPESCGEVTEANLLSCDGNFEENPRTRLLDVGPGTYFFYLVASDSARFGGEIFAEELTEWPEGESCANPFSVNTTATFMEEDMMGNPVTVPVYTPPAMAGEPHVFQLPERTVSAVDRRTVTNDGSTGISCNGGEVGPDAVIEFEKVSDTSALIVALERPTGTGFSDLDLEVVRGCGAGEEVETCETSLVGESLRVINGIGGTYSIWLSNNNVDDDVFPRTNVIILELPLDVGESCVFGRPLVQGANAVTLDSNQVFGRGSCQSSTENVTWFRYTPTRTAVQVTTDADGDVALVDGTGTFQLACTDEPMTAPVVRIVNPGETFCIGVSNGSDISEITISPVPYTGVRGQATDLGIERALDENGFERSWTSIDFMVATPNSLYLGEPGFSANTAFLIAANKAGASRAVAFEDDDGLDDTVMGDCAVAVGEQLFGLDDATEADDEPRFSRIWDGSTLPIAAEQWDLMPDYMYSGSLGVDACTYDGTDFIYTFDTSFSFEETRTYRLSAAAAETPTLVGVSERMRNIVGVAYGGGYYYFIGEAQTSRSSTPQDAVVRVPEAEMMNSTFRPEVLVEGVTVDSFDPAPIFVDDRTNPRNLYFKAANGDVHVVVNPADTDPQHFGVVYSPGSPPVMAFDDVNDTIYLLDVSEVSTGRVIRLD